MTVRRHSEEHFEAAPTAVASAVRTVLARRPPYGRADEMEKDAVFKTNVKPSWWMAGTDMTIHLQPSSRGTQVKVDTKSQWYIMGDAFDYYGRFLRDFFGDLRSELLNRSA